MAFKWLNLEIRNPIMQLWRYIDDNNFIHLAALGILNVLSAEIKCQQC